MEVIRTIAGFRLIEDFIQIDVSKLKQERDGLKGDVNIQLKSPDYEPHVFTGRFNFSSIRSRGELVNVCLQAAPKIKWLEIIESMRVKILKAYSEGEPVEVISSEDEDVQIDFLFYPWIPERQLTLLYGEGGAGKTMMGLFLIHILQNGYSGLELKKVKNILYLDYETEKKVMLSRWKQMKAIGKFFYRKCTLPLLEEVASIKQAIIDNNIDCLFIDSVGVACHGDLNDATTANHFAMAIRQFNVTTIAITHVAKNQLDTRTPFGSVYFFNNARSVIELKKTHMDNSIIIGLFHRKANYSALAEPLVFNVKFEPEFSVKLESISQYEELLENLPLAKKIEIILNEHVSLTLDDIVELTGSKKNTVKKTLSKMKNQGKVINLEHKWMLNGEF